MRGILKPKRVLVVAHRVFGIGMAALLLMWFVTGATMAYVDYPGWGERERLAAQPPLRSADCCAPLSEALRRAGIDRPLLRVRLRQVGSVPVYELTLPDGASELVSASNDGDAQPLSPRNIHRAAAAFAGGKEANREFAGRLDYDQWTVGGGYDDHRPLYKYRLDDARGSEFYLSSRSGEVVLATDAHQRRWSWLGANLHWLYFAELRHRRSLWTYVVDWLAAAGLVVVLTGLINGALRFRAMRRRGRIGYRGLMRWHMVSGFAFGGIALTWLLSGWLSMNPFGLLQHDGPSPADRRRLAGGLVMVAEADADAAIARFTEKTNDAAAIDIRPLGDHLLARVHGGVDAGLWRVDRHQRLEAVPSAWLQEAVARLADAAPAEVTRLTDHDRYYYPYGDEERPLPVLRVQYDDAKNSAYYIDTRSGSLVGKHTDASRRYRWWFKLLHRWDWPALRERPLWDAWILGWLGGGTLLCATGLWVGLRRLRRQRRRRLSST